MLDKHYNMNENQQKVAVMENRIKRLHFEEGRARKMANVAQNRAENMLDARKRHFQDLVLKKNFHTQQKNQMEQQNYENRRMKAMQR